MDVPFDIKERIEDMKYEVDALKKEYKFAVRCKDVRCAEDLDFKIRSLENAIKVFENQL